MIEELLDAPMTVVESARLGKVSRINDAAGRYIEFCKSSVPTSTDFNGLKVVLDCANGATYKIAPSVFRELGAEVTVLAASPNGLNINDKCGSTHLDGLQAAVVEHHADLGIAFDGDGDRVMMVDHTGAVVDGDELLFLIARDLQESGRLQGGVVGTLMSNLGLELALQELHIPFVRAKVGDRYVMAELLARNWMLGGEFGTYRLLPEHHDGRCHHRCATGADGAQASRPDPGRGAPGDSQVPQVLINVRFKGENDPLEHPSVKEASVRVTEQMGGRGRVLLRKSGTEPLVRVMVEGDEEASVRAHAEQLAKLFLRYVLDFACQSGNC